MGFHSIVARVRLWLLTLSLYWRVNRSVAGIGFRIRHARYSSARRWGSTLAGLTALRRLAWKALAPLLGSVVAIVALEWVALGLAAVLPESEFAKTLVARPLSERYSGFLIATAAFGATLIALFYTALSVVVSTGYSRAPVEVRSLLLSEQQGRVYTTTVGLLVAGSLLIVAANFAGYEPPTLTLVVIAVLAGASVLTLLVLGPRAFAFFDIAALALPLRRQFADWSMRAAQAKGGSEFESHFQRQASEILDTYPMLIAEAVEGGQATLDQVERLGHELLRLWAAYASAKTAIPPNSFWFERQVAHRDWLATDDIVMQPALATGTGLPPNEIPDRLWVERRLSGMLMTVYQSLIETGQGRGAYRLAVGLETLAQGLASAFQFDATGEALAVLRSQTTRLTSAHDADRPSDLDRVLRYGLVDTHGLAVVGLVLGLRRTSDHLVAATLWADVDRAIEHGAESAAPYLSAVVDYIEYLRKPLAFEIRVEGRQLTPRWFLRQLVARKLTVLVREALDRTTAAVERDLIGASESADDPVAAAVLATRAMEAMDKLQTHLPTTSAALDVFEAARRSLDAFWPPRDDEALRQRVIALHDHSFDRLARVVLKVPETLDPSIPDYFGHAYTALTSESFSLLQSGRSARFEALFPSIFAAGWRAFERVRASVLDDSGDVRTHAIRLGGPIIDLMELSGYSLLERELGTPGPWAVCKRAWEEFFSGQPDETATAEQLAALVNVRDFPAINPGDILRTSRVQAFHRRLSASLGVDDLWESAFERRPLHPSPLIRAVGHMTSSHSEVVAAFFNECVAPRLPSDAELPRAARFLADSVALQSSDDDEDPDA